MDGELKLVGMIAYEDLRTVLSDPSAFSPVVLAGDIATEEFEYVTPDDTMRTALQKLGVRGSHYIPVAAVREARDG